MRCDVNLTTQVRDVVNEIKWKALDGLVLVGHSYGGVVISGVAEQVLDRIACVIYKDAAIPKDGESFADLAPGMDVGGATIPAPPTSEGDYVSEADRAWVDSKATPQPTATFTEKIRLTGAYERVPNKIYIRAARGPDFFDAVADRMRSLRDSTVYDVAAGHDIEIDAPEELSMVLAASAGHGLQART